MVMVATLFSKVLHVRVEGFSPGQNPHSRQLPAAAASTDVAIAIPRALEGDVEDGAYPSSLHTIHVTSILTDEEVAMCLQLATTYAEATGRWEQPDQERHATYATCDFAIEDCDSLESYLKSIDFDNRMWTLLSDKYTVEKEDLSYIDFFCAHYQAQGERETQTMDRLEAHRDGSLLSFTVLLNSPQEFEGGGTFFDALRDEPASEVLAPGGVVRPMRAGDVVLQCGKILHGADVVRRGKRTVLVGFVDVAPWRQRPGVLSAACKDWGRMDVAKKRNLRQEEMVKDGTRGWFLKNTRWTRQGDADLGEGRCVIRGFCPAFDSVGKRAADDFQRQKKLEAEDVLLRTILLPKGETRMGEMFEIFDGDISVL